MSDLYALAIDDLFANRFTIAQLKNACAPAYAGNVCIAIVWYVHRKVFDSAQIINIH